MMSVYDYWTDKLQDELPWHTYTGMRGLALREMKWAQKQPDADCFVRAVYANWCDIIPEWRAEWERQEAA